VDRITAGRPTQSKTGIVWGTREMWEASTQNESDVNDMSLAGIHANPQLAKEANCGLPAPTAST